VNYTTPQAAYAAREQLDTSEFPPGCILKVLYAEPKTKADVNSVSNSFAQLMAPSSPPYYQQVSSPPSNDIVSFLPKLSNIYRMKETIQKDHGCSSW
jgi:hypothetical protein